MAEDNRAQVEGEVAEFRQFVADCRTLASELASDVAEAAGLLDALEARSEAMRDRAQARLEAFTQDAQSLRAELLARLQRLQSAAHQAGEHAGAASESYAGQVQAALARAGELRERLTASADGIEARGQALGERTSALLAALAALSAEAGERKAQLDEVVDAAVRTEADEHSARIEADFAAFEQGLAQALQKTFAEDAQAHVDAASQALSGFAESVGATGERLAQSLQSVFDGFERRQSEQLQRLQEEAGALREAVEEACEVFGNATGDVVEVAREVGDGMQSAQLGLKVTVGTAEKIRNVLSEVRL